MALSPQLLQFKSSGVYRLEFDKSQTANINVETLRLVVGTSKKGPYNTPVLIDTVESFINVFGNIDRSLEKNRMFFHRSAIEALSRGPILALNLGNFEDGDTANYHALSTNGSAPSPSPVNGSSKYSNFFNTDKFWTPSDVETLNTIDSANANVNNVLNFVNIKQDSITVIARQATNVAEFNMTAREWYGEGNVPTHLNEMDRMSDFMLDVFVFKGEFNSAALANDPIYGDYFDADGLLVDKLNQFANLRQVTLLAQYTGSILPAFKDLEGRNLYIETLINAEARRTGLFCAVNEDMVLEETENTVDFVGHAVDADQDFELLSHVVKQNAIVSGSISLTGDETITVDNNNPYELTIEGAEEASHDAITVDTDFLVALSAGEYAMITGVSNWIDDNTLTSTTVDVSTATSVTATGSTLTIVETGVDYSGDFTTNDYVLGVGVPHVKVVSSVYDGVDTTTVTVAGSIDPALTTAANIELYNKALPTGDFTITCDAAISTAYSSGDTSIDLYNVENSRVVDLDFSASNGTVAHTAGSDNFTVAYASVNIPTTFPLAVGMYVDSATSGRIARIERIEKQINNGTGAATFFVYCNIEPAFDNRYIKSFANSSNYYKTFVLSKANISVYSISKYLNNLAGGNGLYDALIDKDIIDFRYIVDTFGSFDGNILNKRQLSQLAKDRENASAILNAPTVAEFKLSSDPSFKNDFGTFDTRFIADGGNLSKNPTSLYTLPSIAEGSNYAFYYGPGLIVADNGKDIIVPPAAYVANNYIDKYTNALPWSIVAGPRRGVVSGANVKGAEYSFDKNDRDILEPFGINPIVFQRGVGLTILGNKTAQQSIKSALSSAHVREVLIYIQDGMADILKDYVFEFNNVQTRLEIKTLADSFMESVKQDGGVYEFRNIMDSTNNTNEVIDNNMGIIDTYVEPVKGLEIVVHRTTILNTGEIQSGNLG